MPSTPWEYSETARRYRDTRSGRFLSTNDLFPMRDQFRQAQAQDSNELTRRLFSREITVQDWTLQFRAALKTSYLDQYLMARGGRNVATQADYGRVGGLLKSQYGYLQGFAQDLTDGKLSEEAATARGRMYFASSSQAFERGKAAGARIELPAYPGDGGTPCRSHCHCHWQIEEQDGETAAWWRLGAAEHCGPCVSRSLNWAPYVAG